MLGIVATAAMQFGGYGCNFFGKQKGEETRLIKDMAWARRKCLRCRAQRGNRRRLRLGLVLVLASGLKKA
jgi:hypothetical protein